MVLVALDALRGYLKARPDMGIGQGQAFQGTEDDPSWEETLRWQCAFPVIDLSSIECEHN